MSDEIIDFQIRTENREAAHGIDGTVFILEDKANHNRAVIAPGLGFNCFSWQVHRRGQLDELLYADSNFFNNAPPTRSGIPILFPFPNRIRNGQFHWKGKDYQLPRNDSKGKNAIHGFACRRPWRVTGQGVDSTYAWVKAAYQASIDGHDALDFWTGDYEIEVTYRLGAGWLQIEAVVTNPGTEPLPWGLGYHPYFKLDSEGLVQTPAKAYWEQADSLPTGIRKPVDAKRDLTAPKKVSELALDNLLTGIEGSADTETDGLVTCGRIQPGAGQGALVLSASSAFRELVIFTPPHRQAVCLEPYTCITDAINQEQQGIDSGLMLLKSGGQWSGIVQMKLE